MGRGDYLGEFEQIVLLAVARLGDDAYGMAIRREIEARTGRGVAIGAVYATLERLEAKRVVRSREAGPTAPAGRARRFFALTRDGIAALEASREMHRRMWHGLSLGRAGRRP